MHSFWSSWLRNWCLSWLDQGPYLRMILQLFYLDILELNNYLLWIFFDCYWGFLLFFKIFRSVCVQSIARSCNRNTYGDFLWFSMLYCEIYLILLSVWMCLSILQVFIWLYTSYWRSKLPLSLNSRIQMLFGILIIKTFLKPSSSIYTFLSQNTLI